jgi:hypothetical protein
MELALNLSKRTTISPASTGYQRSLNTERNRATAMTKWVAVFVDGPKIGTETAIPAPNRTIHFLVSPAMTASMYAESNEYPNEEALKIKKLTYFLVNHFAPCGRGVFRLLRE